MTQEEAVQTLESIARRIENGDIVLNEDFQKYNPEYCEFLKANEPELIRMAIQQLTTPAQPDQETGCHAVPNPDDPKTTC